MTATKDKFKNIKKPTAGRIAKEVLQSIAIKHLESKYGCARPLETIKKFWKVGTKVVRPYFYTDPRSVSFITALSENTIKSIQDENAYLMAVDYYSGNLNKFTVYFIQPEIILKYYKKAKIKYRQGSESWHIIIKHETKHIIFTRKDAEDAVLPTDKNNYYIQFEMTKNEYEKLKEAFAANE